MNFWNLKNGDIRYSASYVKESGKPYVGLQHEYNGYDKLDFSVLATWEECKRYKLSLPNPEEVVAFEFLSGVGRNYYIGLYIRKEIKKIREKFKEEKRLLELDQRRKQILQQMKKREKLKHVSEPEKARFREWFPFWKGEIEVMQMRLTGSLKEIMDYVEELQENDKYECTSPKKYYPNKKENEFRTYIEATRKREINKYQTRVAGVGYGSRQKYVQQMNEKTPLLLKREPSNPFDENAIQVLAEIDGTKKQVGYIHREFAEYLAPKLDAGEKVAIKNSGIVTETYGDDTSGWTEWSQLGINIILMYEDEVE